MKIQWGMKFVLHKRHKEDEKNLSVRLRITMRGQTPLDFPTGHKIDLQYWDSVNQRAISSAPNSSNINMTIDEWKSIASEIFARFEIIEKRVPTIGEVKDLFNDMSGRKSIFIELPDQTDNLFHVFDIFTSSMGELNQWTKSTCKKFATLKRHLYNFDAHLSFPQFTDKKMSEYVYYMNRLGFRNTTIAKHISFIKWFLRWADSKGYYNGDVHKSFKVKLKGVDGNSKEIIFLTTDEIRKIESYKFADINNNIERVRDVFLFCCFTGLRYSDVAKLKKTDVKDGYIVVVTQKTVDGLRIELNKHSSAILEKYKKEKFKNGLALPVISNQKMNERLKELGQMCGLDEPTRIVYFKGNERYEEVLPKWALLTTHCARRTFVVTALQLGIPSEVIMKWTGHSDFSAMKPYVKIVDELKEQSMTKFDTL